MRELQINLTSNWASQFAGEGILRYRGKTTCSMSTFKIINKTNMPSKTFTKTFIHNEVKAKGENPKLQCKIQRNLTHT